MNLVAILLFVISAGFIAKMVSDKPAFGLIILAVLGLGSLYYYGILNKRNKE